MLAVWWVVVMSGLEFPPVVPVTRWLDPTVEATGFSVVDPYVEVAWLPVIGPSATWMLRRLDGWLPGPASRVEVDLSELGQLLGLGPSALPGSSVQRTMGRLVRFGLADWSGMLLRVRGVVPPLPPRHLDRVPGWAREAHLVLTAGRSAA